MSKRWLGGWSLSQGTFNVIRSILPDGKTILELGSGAGTQELAKHYTMYSIESNKKFVGKYNSNYIYAPIVKYDNNYTAPEELPSKDGNTQIGWYDYKIVTANLPPKYDLIFVDGPTERIGRGGFYKHLNLFNTSVPIVIDDVNRIGGKILLKKVAECIKREYSVKNEIGIIL